MNEGGKKEIIIEKVYICKDKEEENDLKKLIEKGNNLLETHIKKYGYLRGFKKQQIKSLLQNELDGGDERDVNAFELNDYRMPR
jgi:hypothetical protein